MDGVFGTDKSFLGAVRRRTFICCRNVQISASSVARDRSRSTTVKPISLQRSLIPQQDCLILDQRPAGWVCDRNNLGLGNANGGTPRIPYQLWRSGDLYSDLQLVVLC